MTYAIVYSSQTGNARLLGDIIYNTLGAKDCLYIGSVGALDYKAAKADLIYVGFWTDQGQCDVVTKSYLKTLCNQEIFLFGTAGYGDKDYFKEVINKTKEFVPKTVNVVDSFMCQGRMPQSVKDRYDKLAKSPVSVPNLDELIANYERALSHPDEEDIKELKAKL